MLPLITGENIIFIIDNASIYYSSKVRSILEARGYRLKYLLPYLLDLNPIEQLFYALKAQLKKNYYLYKDSGIEFRNFIVQALLEVGNRDARGYFKHSSYFKFKDKREDIYALGLTFKTLELS